MRQLAAHVAPRVGGRRALVVLLGVALVGVGCAVRGDTAGEGGVRVECKAGVDRDADGMGDACELAFATAFAPLLRIAPGSCNRAPHSDAPRLAGEYLFGVRPLAADSVRIVYLPAYHEDCGWSGPKCALHLMDCSGHSGDSEVIALTVVPSRSRWQTVEVFLSAHCFGRSAVRCRWYDGKALDELEWAQAPHGAPIVWIAEGKNASYPSRAACDAGHWLFDTCDRNDATVRFPVTPLHNIGSAAHPIGGDGCVTRVELRAETPANRQPASAVPDEAAECFWTDVAFTGWQRPARAGATPYVRYLRMVFEGLR